MPWTPEVFAGVRRCPEIVVKSTILRIRCSSTFVHVRLCWLPLWLPPRSRRIGPNVTELMEIVDVLNECQELHGTLASRVMVQGEVVAMYVGARERRGGLSGPRFVECFGARAATRQSGAHRGCLLENHVLEFAHVGTRFESDLDQIASQLVTSS